MIEQTLHLIAYALFLYGGFMTISGAIGMVRFPDFYTRMHAACLVDSLGVFAIIAGVILMLEPGIITIKLVLLLIFSLITSATTAHALTKAALTDIVPLGTKLSKPTKRKKKTKAS